MSSVRLEYRYLRMKRNGRVRAMWKCLGFLLGRKTVVRCRSWKWGARA